MAGRFAFNTAIAAVMELINEVTPAKRGDADPGSVRFALATAASLLFPFAPHAAADAYERLTGARVWEEPWPARRPGLPRDRHVRARLPGQRQGPRPRRRRRPAPREDELRELARAQPNVQAHLDGKDVVKDDRRARQARQRRRPMSAGEQTVALGEDAPILEVMATMRAMRRLKPDPVPDELLEKLVEAATWAPSGSNLQAFEFVVVTDRAVMAELAELWTKSVELYLKTVGGVDARRAGPGGAPARSSTSATTSPRRRR